ncbi:MAG TPA: penicillin-binding protein 2, partial [Piscirickettsiaceae bacterium]|nr:penicillin-binding protein 2 [Piscirickettsiaceae bacterium]
AQWLKWQKTFNSYTLPFELDEIEAARFAARSHHFPGIQLTTELKRVYPYGSMTAHVVGYVGRINEKELKTLDPQRYKGTDVIGKSGIEKYYEDLLMGQPGWRQVETNARGRVIRVLEEQPPVNGQDIVLTLDIHLQKKAYALLDQRPGAMVALHPETGAVLAMASAPGYDANLFVDGISRRAYAQLLNNPHRPLINRPIGGVYPPGSTIKPFVALIALEHKIISPNHRIFDPGYFEYAGHIYRDWKRQGHGYVDVHKAISDSCDTFFYQLGLKMGIDLIHQGLQTFGFDQTTGIDLPGELKGLIPNKAWKRRVRGQPWYNGETIIASIGQGYSL